VNTATVTVRTTRGDKLTVSPSRRRECDHAMLLFVVYVGGTVSHGLTLTLSTLEIRLDANGLTVSLRV